MDADLRRALESHPCYGEEAHRKYARMHLPVAPKCNIQCNYCNRKYDCSNESRPGVTSRVLTPEQAIERVRRVKERIPELRVIGIAGPGDPLANEETFRTLELVKEGFPDLTACVSTNGLALPENAQRLFDLGVRFVTVTINAPDPRVGAEIYGSVEWEGERRTGEEGASILLGRQLEGIGRCAELGMLVKANIVMVPEVNAASIPELVKLVRSRGAYIVNILPLIPVPGTRFEGMRAPTPAERKELMDLCSADARMMRHCRQCRADAIGLLGDDRSAEFGGCGCGPGDGGGPRGGLPLVEFEVGRKYTVAVASDGGREVDAGFGNAGRFLVYAVDGGSVVLLRQVRPRSLGKETRGRAHREMAESLAALLDDCDVIAVREIGDMPRSVVEGRGKRVLVTSSSVRDAVMEAGAGRFRRPAGVAEDCSPGAAGAARTRRAAPAEGVYKAGGLRPGSSCAGARHRRPARPGPRARPRQSAGGSRPPPRRRESRRRRRRPRGRPP
ncbi:nitrogenase cofactor biosynthesis protein NifB [Methanomassiliicoccaceae archaeon COG_1]|nr:nitrogenase cofactor biosynthesis protein NifB [Methanomassiliicoccaceae archaeon COG_1]